MSTRKDKFTKKERYYMNLAFNLARNIHGLTGENPPVGCLIVNNDEIISDDVGDQNEHIDDHICQDQLLLEIFLNQRSVL